MNDFTFVFLLYILEASQPPKNILYVQCYNMNMHYMPLIIESDVGCVLKLYIKYNIQQRESDIYFLKGCTFECVQKQYMSNSLYYI